MSRAELAARQAELVRALVAGGPDPVGFDQLAHVRAALVRKRAGQVALAWPLLVHELGPAWPAAFAQWATDRATAGAAPPKEGLQDGWEFARHLHATGRLPHRARRELAGCESRHRHLERGKPRRRRLPALRLVPGGVLVQFGGRVRILGREGN